MLMKCEKCGKQVPEHLDYCPSCKFQEEFGEIQAAKIQKKSPIVDNHRPVGTDKAKIITCQCGQKLEPRWRFCPKCNTPTAMNPTNDSKSTNNSNTTNNTTNSVRREITGDREPSSLNNNHEVPSPNSGNATIYLILFSVSLILGSVVLYLSSYINNFQSPVTLYSFCFLAALIIIITGKINCPNSKIIKVFFVIYLIMVILFIIYFMFRLIMCIDGFHHR